MVKDSLHQALLRIDQLQHQVDSLKNIQQPRLELLNQGLTTLKNENDLKELNEFSEYKGQILIDELIFKLQQGEQLKLYQENLNLVVNEIERIRS
ncbi:hypothetical protein [Flavobacterium psychrotrophum]|uniref:hypothetical protein n=1 Tax=Flavobacterium psychrotrophum TaxID=2294119 RepID=UPI000E310D0A|nr:hypothetical protein [Flavobacterium psychrotrophum]